jgi:AcrR family transcriptional regulator
VPKNEDRRVRRTREVLRRALIDLILDKGYGNVTVQDILDRADVGRSTFYAHYQSKDDLLLSSYADLDDALALEAARVPGETLGPIRALFHFVDEHRQLFAALVLGYELAIRPMRHNLAATLADHLRSRLRVPERDLAPVVAFVLSGLTGMVEWWVATRSTLTPDEMYTRFRALAMAALEPYLA